MKKFVIVILFFVSIFFSQSYGMDYRLMLLRGNIFNHIKFASISRFFIQNSDFIKSFDSVNREIVVGNVFEEEDGNILYTSEEERALYNLFVDEEIRKLRDKDFNEHERLLIYGSILSIITVEEFDKLFGDEEELEALNSRGPRFFIKFIKKKLRFFRQVIIEKQGIRVDLSVIEEENEKLDKLMKKILENKYYEEFSDFDDSDDSGEDGIFEIVIGFFSAN